MTPSRNLIVGVAALVVVAGAAAAYFFLGNTPAVQLEAASNTLRFKAAGVNYAGWPIMGVAVNGQEIGTITIDSPQQAMFTIDVPNSIEKISRIDIRLTNYTQCQSSYATNCTVRSIIFKELYLNDEKIEGGVASGTKNFPNLLQTSEGGVTWEISQ